MEMHSEQPCLICGVMGIYSLYDGVCSTCYYRYLKERLRYDEDYDPLPYTSADISAARALATRAFLERVCEEEKLISTVVHGGKQYRRCNRMGAHTCMSCGVFSSPQTMRCSFVSINGAKYCLDCAEKHCAPIGHYVSRQDSDYMLYPVFPWDAATARVLQVPENILAVYYEAMRLHSIYIEWVFAQG